MVALRPGLPERAERGLTRGLIFKPDGTLVASVHRKLGRGTQVIAFSGRVSGSFNKHELRDVPAGVPSHRPGNRIMKAAASAKTSVRQRLPATGIEQDGTPGAGNVAADHRSTP